MQLIIENITFQSLLRTPVDNVTNTYAAEKELIQGPAALITEVVEVTYDKNKDSVLVKLLTEATEKYPPHYTYSSTDATTKTLHQNPSKTYEIWLEFSPFKKILGKKTSQKEIYNALLQCDVKIWCDSPSFHWQGYNYNLSKVGGALFPTNIPPERWQKIHKDTLLDKHLVQVIRSFPHFASQIINQLKNIIQESNKKIQIYEDEKMAKKIVWSFIRANPPTKAHGELINKMFTIGAKADAEVILFLSHTQDNKKNPLTWEQKVDYILSVFPTLTICGDPDVRSVFHAAVWLYLKGYTDIIVLVGSDRIVSFKDVLEKYNGVETKQGFFKFNSIQILSAGERDADAEGMEGISATRLRNAALDNDFKTFFKLCLTTDKTLAFQMMKDVRIGLGADWDETTIKMEKKIRFSSPNLAEKLSPGTLSYLQTLLTKYNLTPKKAITPNIKTLEVLPPVGIDRDSMAKTIAASESLPLTYIHVRPVIDLGEIQLHFKPNKALGEIATRQQEIAAAYTFYCMIEEDRIPSLEEIRIYYSDCPTNWYTSFIYSGKALKNWLNGEKEYIYARGDMVFPKQSSPSIHEFIQTLAKSLGFKNPNQWNPSDIYLCKKNKLMSVISDLKECILPESRGESLKRINTYLIEKFNDKTLIGISLKLAQPPIKIEEPNHEIQELPTQLELSEFIMKFPSNGEIPKLGANLKIRTKEGKILIVQIRKFTEGSFSPVNVEWAEKSALTRLGKTPVFIRDKWFEKFSLKRPSMADGKYWATLSPDVLQEFIQRAKLICSTLPGVTFSPADVETWLFAVASQEKEINFLAKVNTQLQALVYGELLAKAKQVGELEELLKDWYLGAKKLNSISAPFLKIF